MIKITCDTFKLGKQLEMLLTSLDDIAEQTMIEGLENIKRDAKSMCPVDTGALRDSIDYTYDSSNFTGDVYASQPYALYVELGTRYMAPQPYMHPAFTANEKFFKQRFTELMNQKIKNGGR
jgi:HK97 gp10 family phage protein